ncbi:NAD(P)/FAD-dependent oxidoreductase [Aquabacterium sp.]|uniref:NAD(P)/FAD-dependent oxidoreductase n=1 Tax=Aquabacterium sp. TaxID=1872578 RepID=UPI0035B3ABB1
MTASPPIDTDAVIIGAGPVGLFQVFQLGLHGIQCHVIDALPHLGGQCAQLYPDKPIYDIPGVLMCTGAQLVEQLQQQIRPFGATFHLGHEVASLTLSPADGHFDLATNHGLALRAKVVIVAAGVGAFQPRKLKLEGLDRFEGHQLWHHAPPAEQLAGQRVVIVGGDDDAVRAALALSEPAASPRPAQVTLVHRRDVFNADDASLATLRERIASNAVQFVAGQAIGFETAPEDRLGSLQVLGPDAQTRSVPCDALLVLQGLSPRLGPVAEWGLTLERKQVVVNPATFESSTPGVFAVGDINTYPGKRKLILCGFHEATLAAFAAAALVHPDQPVQLQYTTTSPRLHQLLGVSGAAPSH